MIENVSFIASGGIRLDAALLVQFPSSTRAFVREACAEGAVKVNGRPAEKGRKLKGGETVEVVALAESADNMVRPDRAVSVHAVFEDDALLAFDKPAGIPVQPLSRHETGTLMNGVVARWPEVARVGDGPLMAGALHRIDAGTSGLVLVARTQHAFEAMRTQFAAHAVDKTYLALVEGAVAAGGTLDNELVHDPTLPYCRMKVLPPFGNKGFKGDKDFNGTNGVNGLKADKRLMRAITNFKPLALTRSGMEERTLLEVTIRTGVTHQIRAQLAAAGMHIVNDRLYGAFAVEDMVGHRLHALSTAFVHPVSGSPCRIETPWPEWALKAMG
jgi:23S rRNA pseudouridine1911/1915/1917 synthase